MQMLELEKPIVVYSSALLLLASGVLCYHNLRRNKHKTQREVLPSVPIYEAENMKFNYPALGDSKKAIRLICIQPGTEGGEKEEGEVKCTFLTVPLTSSPPFYTLSYRWSGSPTRIECDAQPIWITANLASLLREMRRKEIGPLWVDAISVNQKDDQEKAAQVNIMFDIYARAQETVIWLGGEGRVKEREGMEALRVLENLATTSRGCIDEKMKNSTGLDLFQDPEITTVQRKEILDTYAKELVWVQGLLSNVYFTRTWMVQEFLISSKLRFFCGGTSLPGRQMWDAVKLLMELGGSLTGISATFFASRALYKYKQAMSMPTKTLTIIQDYEAKVASDPRDKLFAMTRLGSDSDQLIHVNYNLEHTATRTYLDFARSTIRMHGDLSILCVPRTMTGITVPGLPSWVPDWSGEPRSERIVNPEAISHVLNSQYSASGNSRYGNHEWLSSDSAEIPLECQLVDEIECVGMYLHIDIPWNSFSWYAVSVLLSWSTVARLDVKAEYVTGGSTFDAFWQTLLASDNPARPERDYDEEMQKSCKTILQAVSMIRRRSIYIPIKSWGYQYTMIRSGIDNLLTSVTRDIWGYSWRYGRCLTRSKKGYFVLTNGHAKVGDKLFLVRGCQTPLVLREEGGQWSLISDAFVHGLMKGDAYDDTQLEKIIVK